MARNKNLDHTTTRELLISKATPLFAKKGYAGTTVKDIMDATGMNISLVSYHFGGKDGLFKACIEQFGKSRLALAEKILTPPKSKKEFEVRLQMFLESIIDIHVEQPDITDLMHREFDNQSTRSMDVFENTFLRVFQMLLDFFSTAQKQKIIRNDVNAQMAGMMFFGSIKSFLMYRNVRKTFLGVDLADAGTRKKVRDHFLKIFLEGLYSENKR
jgi:TetR/AcrR family transcriptional regulator